MYKFINLSMCKCTNDGPLRFLRDLTFAAFARNKMFHAKPAKPLLTNYYILLTLPLSPLSLLSLSFQLSVPSSQLSVLSSQLPALSSQLPAPSSQLPALSSQLSVLSFRSKIQKNNHHPCKNFSLLPICGSSSEEFLILITTIKTINKPATVKFEKPGNTDIFWLFYLMRKVSASTTSISST